MAALADTMQTGTLDPTKGSIVQPPGTTNSTGDILTTGDKIPPAVITSDAAETDLSKIQDHLNNAKTDLTNQQTTKDAVVPPAPAPQITPAAPQQAVTSSGTIITMSDPNLSYWQDSSGKVMTFDSKNLGINSKQIKAAGLSYLGGNLGTDFGKTANGSIVDTRTSEIISTPGTTPTTPLPSAGPTQAGLDEYTQSIKDSNDRIQAVSTDVQNKINQILNGTFPLNPNQKSQIDAVNQTFDRTKAILTTANTNYVNTMSALGTRLGLSRYGAETATGMIQSAVSYGVDRIADLDAKRSQAIADLEKGFQDDDLKLIQTSYDISIKAEQAKSDEITKIYDATTAALKDARDFADKQNTEVYNQVTKPINDIALEAAKNGASQNVINAIKNAKTPMDAINAAGSSLAIGKYTFQKMTSTDMWGNTSETLWAINQSNPKERFLISGGGTPSSNPIGSGSASSKTDGTDPNVNSHTGLSFTQYGLLANTDLNPKDTKDQMALRYIAAYLTKGSIPTVYEIGGRGMKPEAMAEITQRAGDLFFKATGNPMPNPDVLKRYRDVLATNFKMANNLKVQEGTVRANVDLSLANIKKNDLNTVGFKPLDSLINTLSDMFNDPNVGQLLAQNTTIQNELGSLLAVKNASGTTVYDKLTGAGIITTADNEAQIKQKVQAILTEAVNFADSLSSANADIYKQTDPLLQDPNNPLRSAEMRTSEQKITDFYLNNPDNRTKIDGAINDYKQKYGKEPTSDELLQAFPEAGYSVSRK